VCERKREREKEREVSFLWVASALHSAAVGLDGWMEIDDTNERVFEKAPCAGCMCLGR